MTNLKADEEAVDGIPSIQVILLSFADPTNNGAGHHNVVFAERQILALIRQARREEVLDFWDIYTKNTMDDLRYIHAKTIDKWVKTRLQELHNGNKDG